MTDTTCNGETVISEMDRRITKNDLFYVHMGKLFSVNIQLILTKFGTIFNTSLVSPT